MTNATDSSPKRMTVQIPTASSDAIEAWVHLPEGRGPHPAVVMAHGIGGIKAGGLSLFAERFRQEGFAAIAFDYRNFGGSGGQPREVLSVPRQRADYSTVIGWAAEQPFIDPRQIIVSGPSFAGMHVVELAVSDTRVLAAVAQAPLTDGLAAMMAPLGNGIRLFGLALLDRLGFLFGRQPIYIPGHGRPGDLSIGATPDGPFGEKLASSEERKTTAFAISSGCPRRPSGGTSEASWAYSACLCSSVCANPLSPGVSTGPGLTTFTLIFRSLRSLVQPRSSGRPLYLPNTH
jgi:hypothetical protein